MRGYVVVILMLVCTSVLSGQQPWCAESLNIDSLIFDLQNKRAKALGKAARYEDEAVRWQFREGQFNETRRAFNLAAAARKEADVYQTEIDQLEAQKERIVKEHGKCE